ncbi:GNAT family N-acetyltransferase [Deinococcus apachensis]|uniref:GNAT family N-acetyltransferase n=1 Tax=Deinococcus apachensis TaxID=309886 RepID=UPI0003785167|nr:GNAT family N-acetyltransferase [Deinococcus apachensis]
MLTEPNTLTPEVEALLTRAMFPDPERLRRKLERYRAEPERRIFVWMADGRPVSAAGILQHGEEVEILHLGTAPGEERRGHARALLHAIEAHLKITRLLAETDDEAVGFYRRAGFQVTPAPPKGGSSRYRAVLTRP